MNSIITKVEKELILGLWYKYIIKHNNIIKSYFNSGDLIKLRFTYNYNIISYKKSFIGLCIKKKYIKYNTIIKIIILISNYKVTYNSIITNPFLNAIDILSLTKKKNKNYKKPKYKNSKLYYLKFSNLKILEKKI